MEALEHQIQEQMERRALAAVAVHTLGNIRVWRPGEEGRASIPIGPKEWGRDISLQLFQFFVTARQQRALHKEQIIDRIWGESVGDRTGQQHFKVALHGLNKALETERKSRSEARYVLRQGHSYQLQLDDFWIDADALEHFIALGNQALPHRPDLARRAYQAAIELHHGVYLPNRLYEDWSSDERERLQVLTLGATISLGELLLRENPLESIRLAQQALLIDKAWEDAYRIQMEAYFLKGNRPMAIKTYQQCQRVLDEEFGIEPLPETRRLLERIRGVKA